MKYYKVQKRCTLSTKEAEAVLRLLEELPMIKVAQSKELISATFKIKEYIGNK